LPHNENIGEHNQEKAMRGMQLLLALAAWVSSVGANSSAPNIKIIANSTVKSEAITVHDLKNVYLGKSSTLLDGTRVEPVLAKDGTVHEAFLRQYLGESNEQLQTYYQSLIFSGKGSMPKEVRSDAEMVAYVARTKNAIGYVSGETDTAGLKTLRVEEGSTERKLITRVEPEYPEILRKNHISGVVRLSVTVGRNGNVDDVQILGGNPALAEPAKEAVKKWVYSPGSKSVIEVVIPFDPGN
jgi:TonB family protein